MLNTLKKRLRDVKEGKVKIIPCEEVMARLKKEYKKSENNL